MSSSITSCQSSRIRQCCFSDARPKTAFISIPADSALTKHFVKLKAIECGQQFGVQFSSHEVNTASLSTVSCGMNHVQGGWPSDVNYSENDKVARFLKKIEKDDGFNEIVLRLCYVMEKHIMQNNAIDVYDVYFDCMKDDLADGSIQANILNVYKAGHASNPVRDISWFADKSPQFGVIYGRGNDLLWDPTADNNLHVIDVGNADKVKTILNSEHGQICCIECNPKDSNVLAVGFADSALGYVDLRKSPDLIFINDESDVCGRIVQIKWVNSKNGTLTLLTLSEDFKLCWWQLRQNALLIDSFVLCHEDLNGSVPTCLQYDHIVWRESCNL